MTSKCDFGGRLDADPKIPLSCPPVSSIPAILIRNGPSPSTATMSSPEKTKPNHQPYIKISFFLRKRSDMTPDQFYTHWETMHASLDLAMKCFTDYHVLRWIEYEPRPEYQKMVEQMAAMAPDKMVTMPFDGCTELYFKTWDDWMRFAMSEEYAAIAADSVNFLDGQIHVTAGVENLLIGKALDGLGGKDGIC